MNLEPLEDRRVLAVLYVANDAGFVITGDSAPAGLSAGDTVTWNGGGQFGAVQNLTFGANAFDSINAAITAANPGDTVEVAPGTYGETVDVTKSLTLLGAQNGVDARDGRPAASESILDATNNSGKTQFVVGADDVTIDGFTIQNETNTNQFGAAIYIQPGHHGTHVVNDIVQNNQIGLYLANNSTTDQAVIQHNLFQNNNQTGPGGGQAIYSDQFVAGGAVSDVLIDLNKISGNSNAGIALSGTDPTKPASDITISNNAIDSNGRGIYAYATTSSTISGNDITNSTTPADGGTSVAIGLFGSDNGIAITGNNIENGALRGIRILTDTGTPGISTNQNITINDNSISGFSGGSLVLESGGVTGTLDARNNWWGSNNAATIQSEISGTGVDFSPYLDSGTNSVVSGPGFQGDLSHVDVTSLGSQLGAVGPIEQAIQAAAPGETVTILPGTYHENDIVINKPLTLVGAGSGTTAADTIIDAGGSGSGLTIAASGASAANPLVVSGLHLQNGLNGVIIDSAVSHIKLDNVATTGNSNAGVEIHNSAVINDLTLNNVLSTGNQVGFRVATTGSVNGLIITGGAFDNDTIGLYTNAASSSTGNQSSFTNVTVTGTSFSNDANKGIYVEKLDHATFNGITINQSGTSGSGSAGIDINLKYGNYQDIAIENSSITNSGTGDPTGVGITFKGRSDGSYATKPATLTGVTLTNNLITGNQIGIRAGESDDGATNPTNVKINDNNVSGSVTGIALDNQTPNQLDATLNWWGSNNAASVAGTITGASTPNRVTFSPYLDNGTNSVASGPGFQGDLTHLDVASIGQGTVGPIEQAILAAPAGGTVTIQAGTYVEGDVVIDKNLTLQGVGNVVLQAPSSGSGTGITITGNPQSVTVANFTLNDFANSLTSTGGGTLTLSDLTLNGQKDVFGSDTSVSNIRKLIVNNTLRTAQSVEIAPPFYFVLFTPGAVTPGVVTSGGGTQAGTMPDGIVGTGQSEISFTAVGSIVLNMGSRSDTIRVIPLSTTSVTVDGGDPTPPAKPGDTLNIELAGTTDSSLAVTNGASGLSGAWTFTNAKPVNFSHIETLTPLTVSGQGRSTLTTTEGVATGNALLATFTDSASGLSLSDYSADINWGDGTSSTGTVSLDAASGVYSVSGNHTYAEDGADQIAVTVHRTGSPDLTLASAATVVEPPVVPTDNSLTGTAIAGNEFTPLTNVTVVTFTHGNASESPADFIAAINWGDGTSSTGTVSLSGDTYTVAASHTYTEEGVYPVITKVSEVTPPPSAGGPQVERVEVPPTVMRSTATIAEELMPDGTPGTADQRMVSEVYRDLLQRQVDPDGLAYWSAKLDAGQTRADLVAELVHTDEYRRTEVSALYQTYLHRQADPAGLAYAVKLLADGGTREDVIALLVGSEEYYSSQGGGTDGRFLTALFQDVFARPLDAGAKAHFGQELSAGVSRAQVADQLFASGEYRADVVFGVYPRLLERAADTDGINFFTSALANGATYEQVLAEIINSPEYSDRLAIGI